MHHPCTTIRPSPRFFLSIVLQCLTRRPKTHDLVEPPSTETLPISSPAFVVVCESVCFHAPPIDPSDGGGETVVAIVVGERTPSIDHGRDWPPPQGLRRQLPRTVLSGGSLPTPRGRRQSCDAYEIASHSSDERIAPSGPRERRIHRPAPSQTPGQSLWCREGTPSPLGVIQRNDPMSQYARQLMPSFPPSPGCGPPTTARWNQRLPLAHAVGTAPHHAQPLHLVARSPPSPSALPTHG